MPSLYEKRVFAVGEGGLAVYIPQAWARYYGLKPKDVVIMVADDQLTIKTKPRFLPVLRGKDPPDTLGEDGIDSNLGTPERTMNTRHIKVGMIR